jgi:HlyD family secretion protein
MMLPMRRAAVAVVLVLVGAGAYLVLGRTTADGDGARWVTTAVDRGRLVATVTATGTVNPSTTVEVGTYVSGPIQAIYADYNTAVTKGQLLARIDPRPFQVKLDAARAELANARAQLEKDRADAQLKAVTLRRQRELAARGITAQSDLDLAESQHRQALAQIALDEARIQSAEARVEEAEVSLAYTDITSPVDGIVVARSVAVGQTVAASFQTPTLFLVAGDLTKMIVVASVSESDIGGVARGQEARFTVDAYPTVTFQGRVTQVRNAPVTVQNVVTYDVVAVVDNADLRLKPGMTANVTITTAERPDALRVPTSALRFRPPADAAAPRPPDGTSVWTVDGDGGLRPVPVRVGVADDRFTEVTDGLAVGDQVVTALAPEAVAADRDPPRPAFLPARRRGR